MSFGSGNNRLLIVLQAMLVSVLLMLTNVAGLVSVGDRSDKNNLQSLSQNLLTAANFAVNSVGFGKLFDDNVCGFLVKF